MSGLRAVFACRFPSPPPRRRSLCTPAREGQTFARQDHAEGHPTTCCCAAHRAHVVPRASVFQPSSCEGFVQGVSHPSHGRAHARAQGHGFFPSLLARDAARRRHVSVLGIACRALCFCESVFVQRVLFASPCERGQARAHPSAQDRGVTFWFPRRRACGRRALLVAPSSLRTGLRAMPDWMDKGSCAWCRPGKRNPAQRPSRYWCRRHQGATPVRECTTRLWEGGRRLPWGCLDPTRGSWVVSSAPA
jgi:hypothetical protein